MRIDGGLNLSIEGIMRSKIISFNYTLDLILFKKENLVFSIKVNYFQKWCTELNVLDIFQ